MSRRIHIFSFTVRHLVFFLSLGFWVSPAVADTIVVGADDWCPYNCGPHDKGPGYMVEISARIFAAAGHEIEYRSMPWSRAIVEAELGHINAIIGAGIGDAPGFTFPTEALGLMRNSFWARRSELWQFSGVESLQKVILGVVQDYDYTQEINAYIEKNETSSKVEIIAGQDALKRNIKKLLSGRIDVIIEDENVFLYKIREMGKTEEVIKVGAISGEFKMQQLFIAFSPAHKKSAEYARLLSEGIRRLRASGELAAILAKYGVVDWRLASDQPLHIMTENFPPYNYMEEETLKGPCVDLVTIIMTELNIQADIDALPWPRAYNMIQGEDNQVLFSMARTPAREELFKWVGPLVQYDVYLYKKKGTPISIHSLEEARQYRVGVKIGTAGHSYLKSNGFEKIQIDYKSKEFFLPKLLVNERIDLWLMGEVSAPYIMKLAGFSAEDIEPAFNILSQELYIAFSKSTPDRIVNDWQNTLDQLKSSGKYKEIMGKYTGHK